MDARPGSGAAPSSRARPAIDSLYTETASSIPDTWAPGKRFRAFRPYRRLGQTLAFKPAPRRSHPASPVGTARMRKLGSDLRTIARVAVGRRVAAGGRDAAVGDDPAAVAQHISTRPPGAIVLALRAVAPLRTLVASFPSRRSPEPPLGAFRPGCDPAHFRLLALCEAGRARVAPPSQPPAGRAPLRQLPVGRLRDLREPDGRRLGDPS